MTDKAVREILEDLALAGFKEHCERSGHDTNSHYECGICAIYLGIMAEFECQAADSAVRSARNGIGTEQAEVK